MANAKKIDNSEKLQLAIKELERKVKLNEEELKDNYQDVKQNLNPKRVIKNTFSYVAETPEIQRTLVNTIVGFMMGYASKKAVEYLSEESLDKTVQNIVNHQLTKLENKDRNSLLSKGITLFRKNTPSDSPIYPLIKYK